MLRVSRDWSKSASGRTARPRRATAGCFALRAVIPGWLLLIGATAVLGMSGPVAAVASPPANAFRFFHDADGRLKAAIDPEGDTAVYGWDAAGNLLSITRHASSKLSVIQLSPARGEVGATVMIEGTGFSTTPASNTVKFNGTTASVSAASATSLTVKVPGGATTGSVTVSTGEEGPATSPESFTVVESSAPKISSISPTLAAAEEEITISGSNFEPAALSNVVTLNRARPEVVSSSSSTIKFKVPPATLGGHVSVATPAGSSTGPDLYIPPSGTTISKVGSTARFSLGESKLASFAGSEKSPCCSSTARLGSGSRSCSPKARSPKARSRFGARLVLSLRRRASPAAAAGSSKPPAFSSPAPTRSFSRRRARVLDR